MLSHVMLDGILPFICDVGALSAPVGNLPNQAMMLEKVVPDPVLETSKEAICLHAHLGLGSIVTRHPKHGQDTPEEQWASK